MAAFMKTYNFLLTRILLLVGGALFAFNSIFADGFIVIPNPVVYPPFRTTPFPLEVSYHKVKTKIEGLTAETFIDQAFINPTRQRLEGYYIFPIPKGAAIKNFSMMINGVEHKAELLDAEKARKIYEDIVRQSMDPALLEYSEQGLFRARIFPIEPLEEKRIKISYTEVLTIDDNVVEYIYPLNTEKFSSKPLKNVLIQVEIKFDREIKDVYSPSHNMEISRKNENKVIATYEENDVKPDIDFKIYINLSQDKIGVSLFTYNENGEDGYFLLNLIPAPDAGNEKIIEKDIAFIIDVSGSMAGDRLDKAKSALLYCVENLNRGDRFEIIKFSTEAYSLFKKLEIADKNNIKRAKEFIENLKPTGGTNIEESFELAFGSFNNFSGRPSVIIFITDGKPTIGEINEDKLVKKIESLNKNKARIFSFGLGTDLNSHLLDKISETSKGLRYYASPKEDIELKVSRFYKKIQSPALIDLSINSSGNIELYQMYPKNPPDLYYGSALTILGRYKGKGKTSITLSGTANGKRKEYSYNLEFKKKSKDKDFIPPLWAARRIGYLLDQIRLNGESKELKDEIIELAKRHGIITPYTSYLILEDQIVRNDRRELRPEFQIFGRKSGVTKNNIQKSDSEYYLMSKKEGEIGVRSSEELQALNLADNIYQTKQGHGRMQFVDKNKKEINLIDLVKNAQGRAFYQDDEFWVDSDLQRKKTSKNVRIKFASEEYFKFLNANKETAQFLSLGRNVRFYYNGVYYEIFEG